MLANGKHERFVQAWVRTGSSLEAYREVYGRRWRPVNDRVCAHKLRNKPRLKMRYRELMMAEMKRSAITAEKILSDYQRALDMAESDGKPGEMIAAAREQAKLVGLLVDRKEIGGPGAFEHLDSISEILEEVGRQVGPEAALALGKAFRVLEPSVPPPEEQEGEHDLAALPAPSGSVN